MTLSSQIAFTSFSAVKKVKENSTEQGAAESVDSARSGHEDTCYLVKIPQRELFMSWNGDSGLCTVISQES